LPLFSHPRFATNVDVAFLKAIEEIDAEWVGAALERAGAIVSGRVEAIEAEFSRGNWSRIAKLKPRYSPDAVGELPARLLVKMCSGAHAVFGRSEVDYYRRDYVGYPLAPLPRCYAAECDIGSRDYVLVLEDLSETHAGDHARAAGSAAMSSLLLRSAEHRARVGVHRRQRLRQTTEAPRRPRFAAFVCRELARRGRANEDLRLAFGREHFEEFWIIEPRRREEDHGVRRDA
jgi:hypothetical protein